MSEVQRKNWLRGLFDREEGRGRRGGGGAGSVFIQNLEQICVGEHFCYLANISSLFPDENFSSDIMNIFDLNWVNALFNAPLNLKKVINSSHFFIPSQINVYPIISALNITFMGKIRRFCHFPWKIRFGKFLSPSQNFVTFPQWSFPR